MSNIKFTAQTMQLMLLFEKLTRSHIKDCFEDDHGLMTIIVAQGNMQKALGPKASNVQKIKNVYKKNVRLIEFNTDVIEFIKNVARPIKLVDVRQEDNVFNMVAPDLKNRGYLIGRNAQTLRNNENIVKRYFPIQEIKVDKVNE
ncbi:MAG: NusA-like KH domain protein [Candidatus Woesearchaeota archaeon]|jgi:NusA-like KH domain protein